MEIKSKTIKSTADISLKELSALLAENLFYIIVIYDKNNYPKPKQYDIFKMVSIKKAINEFLENCPERDPNNQNTEKEIFTYIYTKLAYMVEYDELARDINHSNSNFRAYALEFLEESSGLYGAMVEKIALCSGFAEALRNLLAERGIESRYVEGWSKQNKGMFEFGHAWNQVKLDGEWFNCDVTNDRLFIIDGLALPNFLKANYDFSSYRKYPLAITPQTIYANRSIPRDYQYFLVSHHRNQILRELSAPKETKESAKPKFLRTILKRLSGNMIPQKGEA